MSSFEVRKWEIWYTFSTYFESRVDDLESVARTLVELEISDCVVLSNGQTFCRVDEEVVSGETILKISGDLKQASARFDTNSELELTGYARETWLIGVQFLFAEARQISPGMELPTPHLRAFLKPIVLIKEEEKISRVYPVIILYKSGILIIEFRLIGPNEPVPLDDFISEYVNIQQCDYNFAFVPPMLSALASEAYYTFSFPPSSIIERLKFLRAKEKQKNALRELTQTIRIGDFDFDFAPLSKPDGEETITSIALTLFSIFGLITQKPASSINFLLKGQTSLPSMGNYWSGKPHIHLIDFSDQQDSSSSNEEIHREAFGKMLARVSGTTGSSSEYVPLDARKFEDYSAYITSSATLWAWSKSGIDKQKQWMDINNGHLIYEHQTQIELLEYGFMLHKALVEKSGKLKDLSGILATRRDLVELKSKMLETTPFGEVRDLLIKGWEKMNVEAMQSQILENLSILESEIKLIESKMMRSEWHSRYSDLLYLHHLRSQ
ncbi:hypothetical protein IQ254_25510 [Nodosilinea sp. LEGE 07088]|uniref:hypothetical protein n=1 Tax=Nodosilinea sp. LEGE 07088 TaxID=2777968 RepID=UPI001882E5EA|nr:hypothetical protein [Nodosilinea sp. LEGE 07088]MBE9140516.1 hypothetical protein [Nodosilinea sp. LEGE 07088]